MKSFWNELHERMGREVETVEDWRNIVNQYLLIRTNVAIPTYLIKKWDFPDNMEVLGPIDSTQGLASYFKN